MRRGWSVFWISGILTLGCGQGVPQSLPSVSPSSQPITINFTGFAGGHNDSINAVVYNSGSSLIYAAGSSYDSSGNRQAFVSRYLGATGALDTTFNSPNGFVLSGASGFAGGHSDSFNSFAIDGLGNLIAGGTSKDAGGNIRTVVARYTSLGALDTGGGFNGASGFILGPLAGFAGGGSDGLASLSIYSANGSIACGGITKDSTGTLRTWVGRYTSAGVIDTGAFNAPNGFVLGPVSGFGSGNADALNSVSVDQTTGNIVASGSSTNGVNDIMTLVLRYTSAGSLDTAGFNNPKGYALGPSAGYNSGNYDVLMSVAVDGIGRLVSGGYSYDTLRDSRTLAVRTTSAGALDTAGFSNPSGYILGSASGFAGGKFDLTQSLSLDPVSGNIVLGGSSSDAIQSNYLVVRLQTNGALDTTFNGTGYATGIISNSGVNGNVQVQSVFVDSSQRILVGGTVTFSNGYQQSLLMRFLSSGARDF